MRIIGKVSYEKIKLFSIVFTIFCLLSIGKDSCSLEYYKESLYEDNNLSAQDYSNGDEDDEKDIHEFTFSEGTKSWTTTVSNGRKEPAKCNEDKIMYYLAELQVINPETILQIASFSDIDRSCRKISNTLKFIDALMQTCIPLPQSHLYMQLIMGVRVLFTKLCVQSDYRLAFKEYMGCFQELHNEYIDCGGPADWTENMDESEICTEYKAITDCYYTKTALLCGIKAAKTMKELVVRVINAVIETRCPEVRKNPLVEDAMPEHAIYTRQSGNNSTCRNLSFSKLHAFLLLFTIFCIVY